MLRRIPIIFSPQPEGGYTVTSPILPELITEGDTLEEAYANVSDALAAVIELYEAQGRWRGSSCRLVAERYREKVAGRIANGSIRQTGARRLFQIGAGRISRLEPC